MTKPDTCARYCADLGWYLVAIPAGSKAPTGMGWQKPERAICTPEAAHEYWTRNPEHNVGLLHSASGTVAIDVDHVEWTRIAFEAMGLDYDSILSSGPRIVGRKDRAKVLFRAPDGFDVSRRAIAWPKPDGRGSETVFELRGGAVQDVLPPSVHPDTGNAYTWAGQSLWDGLPPLPDQLAIIWREWDRFKPQLMDACPWQPEPSFRPPAKPRPQGERASVIGAYNDANSIHDTLARYGYRKIGKRYLSPNSTSKIPGVVVFDDTRAYSHHASDPFDDAHTFDAFDLFCTYDHGGDVAKAVKDAAGFLHLDTETPEHDPELSRHGKAVWDSWKGKKGPLSDIPEHLLSVPGVLNDVVTYYSTTAPKDQPQFAVQAALAFGATVMGRRWVTDQDNMTSLFFVNVGKSAAGKEHVKKAIERCLEAANLDHLIGPSGYTSAAGLMSALRDQPNHISIIDELGRVLASSQAQGNYNKADAQTLLMEVWGRQTSTLRPQGYSTGTLSKDQKDALAKIVRHPSLTLMTMTTPSTFYETLSGRYVADGFLGRFLIVESHIGRQEDRPVRRNQPISERLIQWAKDHASAHDGNLDADSAETPPAPVEIPFDPSCAPLLKQCTREMIAAMDDHERHGLEAMFGRTKEIAHRLALIVARSNGHDRIMPEDLQWSIDYATFYARRTVAALIRTMSDGPFDAACKAVFAQIEGAGIRGVTERELARSVPAFRNMEPRKRKEVMEALASDKGITCRNLNEGQRGKPRFAWLLPGDEADAE